MVKYFIDSANLQEIKQGLDMGFKGITTNPSLIAKEPKEDYIKLLQKIIKIINEKKSVQVRIPLSVEVFTDDNEEIIKQAIFFKTELNYNDLVIKVHISYKDKNNLKVIRKLSRLSIDVNCTACITPMQALLASQAGARYVSLLWNRIKDGGENPTEYVSQTNELLPIYTEIIVGSIREPKDILEASLAGADIVTFHPKFIPQLLSHPQTDKLVEQFFSEFEIWKKGIQ